MTTAQTNNDQAQCLQQLVSGQPTLWINPAQADAALAHGAGETKAIGPAHMLAAEARFARFAPLLADLFPELQPSGGRIESGLLPVPALQAALGVPAEFGALWIKADHSLPVAGSIKARGGIHEVLEFAERLAMEHGLLNPDADYRILSSPAVRTLFSRYEVAVGSTGNLGLSIGVMASALGFRATVHMSADAKAWKKDRLRARGVSVVEHSGDYEQAVAAGRRQAAQDPFIHFIDDERSLSLFLGYSAAAPNLGRQIEALGIVVDARHPLFVYLPCGVGGAPGGITFGLKQLYGPHVHCFFVEPVQSPCFLLRMLDRRGAAPSVYDIGLNNRTEADGLAVPRASDLAADVIGDDLSGVCTVADDTLFHHLYLARQHAGLQIEPSAAAGFSGPAMLRETAEGQAYLDRHGLLPLMHAATHIAWTTGGLFVPDAEYRKFLERGASLDVHQPG
ncbi:MAG: D-serine ammonia-lyase [Burkholderiaceae bacterium]